MQPKEEPTITEAEAALYDRQIRLWGLDAQRRLRGAKVLLIGVGGLGAEVAKNIILAGIKSITLLDEKKVTEEDFSSQFLADRADIGKNRAESSQQRAQALNPMVEVSVDTESLDDKNDEFLQQFDIVCATECSQEQLVKINTICHNKSISFYAGDVFGYYGFMFADLNHHEYAEDVVQPIKKVEKKDSGEPAEKKAKTEQETVVVKNSMDFKPLKDTLSIDWSAEDRQKSLKRMAKTHFIILALQEFYKKHKCHPSRNSQKDQAELLKCRDEVCEKIKINKDIIPEDFNKFCFSQLSPVCAVVGGVLGQEIIKAVSQKDAPHNNFFFYNGVEGSGMVDLIS